MGGPMVSLRQDDHSPIVKYGEVDYVDQHVLNGEGRKFLKVELDELVGPPYLIKQMTKERRWRLQSL